MQNQIIEFIDSSTRNHERLLDIEERKFKIEEEKLELLKKILKLFLVLWPNLNISRRWRIYMDTGQLCIINMSQ